MTGFPNYQNFDKFVKLVFNNTEDEELKKRISGRTDPRWFYCIEFGKDFWCGIEFPPSDIKTVTKILEDAEE